MNSTPTANAAALALWWGVVCGEQSCSRQSGCAAVSVACLGEEQERTRGGGMGKNADEGGSLSSSRTPL